ncbi:hypothetical protein H012_gp028 [Acanthamoeba polyphaga moumouvirus]|uniref:Uncharacterized protein n=1 Tax=Acanthamoeba polyphaga moumouvirus TaxID=1269028 RepID=L7RGZ0_9VIRU|nr:hypothetical protein H012_gp028 [Acanthamoeba polyphaga moumouvirus]AGC02420.1 hypothetical protein Moumou_00905 [Acanthamoeba polyphaga moumouvirus]
MLSIGYRCSGFDGDDYYYASINIIRGYVKCTIDCTIYPIDGLIKFGNKTFNKDELLEKINNMDSDKVIEFNNYKGILMFKYKDKHLEIYSSSVDNRNNITIIFDNVYEFNFEFTRVINNIFKIKY